MIIVLTGVTGSGKTTLGEALSDKLGWPFFEGDKFHSKENIEKMSQGVPLNDSDRIPWLESIAKKIKEINSLGGDAIFACSALKHSYRELLKKADSELNFVFLKGDKNEIRERLSKRKGHFMPESLVDSQFAALEEPSDKEALKIEGDENLKAQIEEILNSLGLV